MEMWVAVLNRNSFPSQVHRRHCKTKGQVLKFNLCRSSPLSPSLPYSIQRFSRGNYHRAASFPSFNAGCNGRGMGVEATKPVISSIVLFRSLILRLSAVERINHLPITSSPFLLPILHLLGLGLFKYKIPTLISHPSCVTLGWWRLGSGNWRTSQERVEIERQLAVHSSATVKD